MDNLGSGGKKAMKKSWFIAVIVSVFLLQGCVSPQQRRRDYVDEHPGLSREVASAILKGVISEGMTREDVKASWGEADLVTTAITEGGIQETWSYNTPVGQFNSGKVILTFSGGKLVGVVN
jgi:outer membrane murein-binding lipoprotein Lpp